MTKIPNEAIDLTISILNTTPELHFKACFLDVSNRPEFDCICPIQDIVKKLLDINQSQKKG